jgi:ADP-ribose pyrophosphatase YjhB (NUDIX family)
MADLQQFPAKKCYTAAAFLIVDKKILFIKHKKLGIWFAPGGHLEPNELPHHAAERECFEESGVKVRAIDLFFKNNKPYYDSPLAEYLPSPFLTNLHWVSQDNYQARLKDPTGYQPIAPWKKGCEQHLGYTYLVEPIDSLELIHNEKETDGIGWFTPKQVQTLETTDDIRFEVKHAFQLLGL